MSPLVFQDEIGDPNPDEIVEIVCCYCCGHTRDKIRQLVLQAINERPHTTEQLDVEGCRHALWHFLRLQGERSSEPKALSLRRPGNAI